MQNQYSCKKLVKDLQTAYVKNCADNNTLIINDIQPDFSIKANKEKISYLLSNVINIFISKSKYSCIRISAKKYNNVVLMHLKNNNVHDFSLNTPSLQQMQTFARSIGACISLNDYRPNATTLTISFANSGSFEGSRLN